MDTTLIYERTLREFSANLLHQIGTGLIGNNFNPGRSIIISGQSLIRTLILDWLFSQIYLTIIEKRVLEKSMFSNLGYILLSGWQLKFCQWPFVGQFWIKIKSFPSFSFSVFEYNLGNYDCLYSNWVRWDFPLTFAIRLILIMIINRGIYLL